MLTELGPFVVGAEGNVTLNPWSWNSVANVLFLEQPAGVGFSYPVLPANDSTTAEETVEALVGFLRMHTELRGRKVYVMGESYGGHYVPNTAAAILSSNARLASPDAADHIELVGFAVGNGYTDWQLDFNENVPNGRYHALTSHSRYDAAERACGGNFARCFWPREDVECPKACDDAVQAAVTDAMDGTIDIYDIYEDVCLEKLAERSSSLSTPLLEPLHTQQSVLLDERRRALKAHAERRGVPHRSRELQTTISPVFPT